MSYVPITRIVSDRRGVARAAGGEWSSNRMTWGAATQPASGVMALTYFEATVTESINSLAVFTNVAGGAGATPSLVRFGVYSIDGSGNGTLIGASTHATTNITNATTRVARTLNTPWSKVAGTVYALGVLVVSAAAMPIYVAANPGVVNSAMASFNLNQEPRLSGQRTAQSDLPGSYSGGVASSHLVAWELTP